ncbi:MAG: GntR family transcriptional regulator [Acidobacteriota bacterium]
MTFSELHTMLYIDPSDSVPIWKQIEQGVLHLIATGALGPGDAVTSVRELARQLRVNPLTVSKAYRRLADQGILAVRRGEGTFVAEQPPVMADQVRTQKLEEVAHRYVVQASHLSADEDESVDAVRRAWKKLEEEVS